MKTAITSVSEDTQHSGFNEFNVLKHFTGTIRGCEQRAGVRARHEMPKENVKDIRGIRVLNKPEGFTYYEVPKSHKVVSRANRGIPKNHRGAHGKPRVVSELETNNASPSDTDASASSVSSKKPRPPKIRKKRFGGMAKELDLLKTTSEQSLPLEILADFGVHVTRRTSRLLIDLFEKQPTSPRESLNLALISDLRQNVVQGEMENLEEESQYQRSSSPTSDNTDPILIRGDELLYNSDRKVSIKSSPVKLRVAATVGVAAPGNSLSLRVVRLPRKWDEWIEQKTPEADLLPDPERVTALLNAKRYSTKPACTASGAASLAQQPAYQALVDLPPNYNFAMDAGVYVFSPTKEIFDDFASFVEVIEAVAGRKHGVVKVIVPEEVVLPTRSAGPDSPQDGLKLLPSTKVSLRREKVRSNEVLAYHLDTTPAADISVSSLTIEQHRMKVIDKWAIESKQCGDAWREASYETTVDEEDMIRIMLGKEEQMLLTLNVEDNNVLRRSLACKQFSLKDLRGNRFLSSKYKPIDSCHSSMAISHNGITPFGINLEDLAAYSISYLHKGAPRCWTIIKPADHSKLEKAMQYELLDTLSGIYSSTPLPPQCDQALGHRAIYLPKATLQRFDVDYLQVVQHQNEMIITFPFTYRQGYNTGPNISEEIAYASERWEVFPKKHLYRQCDEKCPKKSWQSSLILRHGCSEIVGSGYRVMKNGDNKNPQYLHRRFHFKDAEAETKAGKEMRIEPRGRKRSVHDRRDLARASKADILPEAKRPVIQQEQLREAISDILND